MTTQFKTQTEYQEQFEKEQFEFFKDYANELEYTQIQQQQQQGEDGVTVIDETVEASGPSNKEREEGNDGGKEGEEEEGEQEEEILPIVDEVTKQIGIDLQVDYPEGVVPDSPEGVYIWANKLMEYKEQETLANFRASYPDAYKMALWIEAGNDPKDFGATVSNPNFEDIKDNLDVQKSLFLRSYKEKDIDEDDAKELLEKAIKKGTLAKQVEDYLKKDTDRSTREAEDLVKQIEAREKAIEDRENGFQNTLYSIFNTKVFDFLRIPDSKIDETYTKFVDNVTYNEESQIHELRIPITNQTVKDLIPLMYMMQNKQEFVKTKQGEGKAQEARTLQRNQVKIEKEQKTIGSTGLDPKYFK